MASLTASIGGISRTPLLAGSTVELEQPTSRATLIIEDSGAAISIAMHDQVLVQDGATILFTGIVLERTYDRGELASGRFVAIEAQDYTWYFDHPPDTISASYVGESDQAIVIDLVNKAGLSGIITANTTNVDSTTTGLTLSIGPNATLREALDQMATLTGAKWWMDGTTLKWQVNSGADTAPWNVDCDAPNNTTTFDVQDLTHSQRFDDPINSFTAVGGTDESGVIIKGSASDATSISTYGTFRRVEEDDNWVEQSQVDAIASAAVSDSKDPVEQVAFSTLEDGAGHLLPNQSISITCADYGLSAKSLVIRRVGIEQLTDSLTRYSVEAGEKRPTLEGILRRIAAQRKVSQSVQKILGAEFSSATDTISLGDVADFDGSDWSVGMWIFPYALPTADSALAEKGDGTTSGWRFDLLTSGKLQFKRARTTTDRKYVSTDVVVLNKWSHILLVEPFTSAAKIYINGVEVSYDTTTAGSGAGLPNATAIEFGNDFDGVIKTWVGWASPLSSGDVAAASSTPLLDYTGYDWTGNSTVAELKLDDWADGETSSGSGSWVDSSGKGNHGTPSGSVIGRSLPWAPAV